MLSFKILFATKLTSLKIVESIKIEFCIEFDLKINKNAAKRHLLLKAEILVHIPVQELKEFRIHACAVRYL